MLYPNGTTTRPKISSPYGPRDPRIGISSMHAGADLVGYDTIHAVAAGRVTFAGWMNNAAGNTIIIDHGHGVTSVYMHNAAHHVRKGDRVTEAQPIATMGKTGNATGPCNHFEIRIHSKHTDPLAYVAARLTNNTGEDDMIQNIKGRAGVRNGGAYLLAGGRSTFLGHDPKFRAPFIEDEGVIRKLAATYPGDLNA